MLLQCDFRKNRDRFAADFEAQKSVPKGEQNGAQNGPKSNAKINMKQEGFEDPLGSVLGLSWVVWGVDLGVKNHQISLVFKGFREKSCF